MKSFTCFLFIFIFIVHSLFAQTTKTKSKAKESSMQAMPYTAMYSSQFEISDPKFSSIVLNAWKVYDENKFDQATKDYFSDTIHATLGSGMPVNGKDSFLNAIVSFRSGMAAVKSDVIAYMSVKSTDKHDNLVLIWGTETDTKQDGTTEKYDLHEVWGFNKDGKVDFFKQFVSPIMTGQ